MPLPPRSAGTAPAPEGRGCGERARPPGHREGRTARSRPTYEIGRANRRAKTYRPRPKRSEASAALPALWQVVAQTAPPVASRVSHQRAHFESLFACRSMEHSYVAVTPRIGSALHACVGKELQCLHRAHREIQARLDDWLTAPRPQSCQQSLGSRGPLDPYLAADQPVHPRRRYRFGDIEAAINDAADDLQKRRNDPATARSAQG